MEKKLRENRVGVSEDGAVDPVSIALIPAPGIPYDWSIVTVYFNTCLNHLPLRKHVECVKPSYTAPFDILTRETVFQKVGGLRYLRRCFQALPFSIPAVFRSFAI